MTIASIDVWVDPPTARSCHVEVFDNECVLELRALGQRVLTLTCSSVPDALERANQWRPSRPEVYSRAS
jgi:hypothetical protein